MRFLTHHRRVLSKLMPYLFANGLCGRKRALANMSASRRKPVLIRRNRRIFVRRRLLYEEKGPRDYLRRPSLAIKALYLAGSSRLR